MCYCTDNHYDALAKEAADDQEWPSQHNQPTTWPTLRRVMMLKLVERFSADRKNRPPMITLSKSFKSWRVLCDSDLPELLTNSRIFCQASFFAAFSLSDWSSLSWSFSTFLFFLILKGSNIQQEWCGEATTILMDFPDMIKLCLVVVKLIPVVSLTPGSLKLSV